MSIDVDTIPSTRRRAGGRQKAMFDGLWSRARHDAFSTDLIRFGIWRGHLGSPVLDIGAGDALLARSFPEHHIVSLDLSAVGLRRASGPAVAGAAEALPIRDATMRSVVLAEVLEHASDPQLVLAECRRVLAPDGVLLLSTPLWPLATVEHLYHWRRIGQRPTLANLRRWDPTHERRYALDDLLAEVRAARLSVRRVVPLFRSATTAAVYVVEPLVARVTRRQPRWAQRLTGADRLLGAIDRASAVALVCTPC